MPRRPAATLLALALLLAAPAASLAANDPDLSAGQRDTLLRYARDTWAGFVAMTDPDTGLPADSLKYDGTASVQTSTTNIGAYMWSTVVARELKIIRPAEARERLSRTIATLETMERHEESGQFYNWYDHTTGEKLTVWPPTGEAMTPILSSVDNGWLATGLKVVAESVPQLSDRAGAIYDSMDFGFYYVPERNLIRFHFTPSNPADSPCCYDTIVSESRIASYIGIAKGELPEKEYFGAWRTFPATCDWSWHETQPVGFDATYLGVNVFEGAYPYEDFRVVPGWGGSMFEALMPALFVPEEEWAPQSWAVNHPLTITAQIHHGLVDAEYGYWGFSPANIPEGGYTTYGVDAIGMDPGGYPSNNDKTLVDRGFGDCPGREPQPEPPPSAYTNGVVTPHAAFLALRWAPDAVMENLENIEADFNNDADPLRDMYDRFGFRDSVNVDTGEVSDFYLSLDQGIVMAAIGNALAKDVLRDAFATKDVRNVLEPVIGMERFNAGPLSAVDYDPAP
jgi:Putative glucoamylase/Protein of unknown function (DUF3131)